MSALAHRASEDVIINSPMSFAGAAQRAFRLRRSTQRGPERAMMTLIAAVLTLAWWLIVASWYVVAIGVFGIVTIPYRLLRRSARKRKMEARRHRELMAAVEAKKLP
jgi:Flp pilus assembly protein TadB